MSEIGISGIQDPDVRNTGAGYPDHRISISEIQNQDIRITNILMVKHLYASNRAAKTHYAHFLS